MMESLRNESKMSLVQSHRPPSRHPVMYQSWDDLLFFHWRCDTEQITSLLPSGLSADLYNGISYISIIAFRMNSVRPAYLPALPWLSYFYELNVRVYVRDLYGVPGVYFLSLDCNRAAAVWIARTAFSLPYQHATMSFSIRSTTSAQDIPLRQITCKRLGQKETALYRWSVPVQTRVPKAGSLEFFLTERYNFFTLRRGVLMRGLVHHEPYKLSTPAIESYSALPITWNSFVLESLEPELISYSPGVKISAFLLQRCQDVGKF